MARTYVSSFFHIVYWKKRNAPGIRPEDEKLLYPYMGGIIKGTGGIPIVINGTKNHLHILTTVHKTISLSAFIEKVKSGSSKWIKTIDPYYKNFYWQAGFGAFSVNEKNMENLIAYIQNQKKHHAKQNYREELLKFLKNYGIDYDERFLCD